MKHFLIFLVLIMSVLLSNCDSDLTKENKILTDTSDWYKIEVVRIGTSGDVSMWCDIPEIKFDDTTGIGQFLDINWNDYWGTPNCFVTGIPDSLNIKGNKLIVKLRKMKNEEIDDISCIMIVNKNKGPFGVITDIMIE